MCSGHMDTITEENMLVFGHLLARMINAPRLALGESCREVLSARMEMISDEFKQAD